MQGSFQQDQQTAGSMIKQLNDLNNQFNNPNTHK
jgi:hypothetical protein